VPREILKWIGLGVGSFALSACSELPDSGPSARDVVSHASASIKAAEDVFQYALVDLSKGVLPYVVDPGPGSLLRTFGAGHSGPPEIKVGVGDTVQVTLFESQAGGLFIPQDAGARPGNYVQLPAETIDSKGYISVPYAGPIMALNRTTKEIQADIVEKLTHRAIEPQALVSILSQTSTQVTVVGEVNNPNKVNVNPAGDRILDVIARTGGIRDPGYETFVTLQRGSKKSTVYFPNLIKNATENIFVAPRDTVYVYQYQRAFTAFGATGQSGQYKFQQENMTLTDAVGRAGGLLDARSDPGQVFVYRIENRSALEKMGVDTSKFPNGATMVPTIYRVNFRDPSGYFAATTFPMRDQDILYVDNADYVELTKFISLITSVTSGVASATSGAATSTGAVKYLQHPNASSSVY